MFGIIIKAKIHFRHTFYAPFCLSLRSLPVFGNSENTEQISNIPEPTNILILCKQFLMLKVFLFRSMKAFFRFKLYLLLIFILSSLLWKQNSKILANFSPKNLFFDIPKPKFIFEIWYLLLCHLCLLFICSFQTKCKQGIVDPMLSIWGQQLIVHEDSNQ